LASQCRRRTPGTGRKVRVGMAERMQRSFYDRWAMPLVVGPMLTVGVMAWLYHQVGPGDLHQPSPTFLDFKRPLGPAPTPLKGTDGITDLGNVPPPGQTAPVVRSGAAVNDPVLTAAASSVLQPDQIPEFEAEFNRVTILDAGHFKAVQDSATINVTLRGIVAPAFSDSCTDPAGKVWKCGGRARAEVARLVGPKSVGCANIEPQADGSMLADCYAGNRSLARWAVEQGWADPADPADTDLKPLADDAKGHDRGRFGAAPS